MDPKDVARPSDIMMAADTLLHAKPVVAPPETKTDTAAPDADLASTTGEPAPAGEDDAPAAGGGEPAPRAPDAADEALNDPLKARAAALAKAEAQFEERKRLADIEMDRIFKDPTEYDRARKELGLAPEAAAPVKKPAGPDPIDNPDAWRYRRTLVYQQHAAKNKTEWTPDEIQEAVERDLRDERDAAFQKKVSAIDERLSARERAEQDAALSARERVAQATLDKALEPILTKHYPKGVSADTRETIDAHVALARSRGQKPDLNAIVAKVSGQPQQVIQKYVGDKRQLAAGANAARGSGSGSPAPVSIIDKLPATLESIGKIGEMRAAGKLK